MKRVKHAHLDSSLFEKFSNVFLALCCVAFLFPFVMSVIVSFTSEDSIAKYGYQLIPKEWSVESYKILFTAYGKSLGRSILLTVSTGIIEPILTVFLSMLMAYPLSQPDFKGKDFWRVYLLITMLFSGGLIPSYILRTRILGLRDTIWVYIIPTLGAWNIFLFRTFFVGIDKSMIESAKLDGANNMQVMLKIMMPLTKPLVVMNFFSGFISNWNDISTSLYYITRRKLYTVQYLLQEMLRGADETKALISAGLIAESSVEYIPVESIRYAVAVIGALPVLILFPYFQRYYSKGITLGSTKG